MKSGTCFSLDATSTLSAAPVASFSAGLAAARACWATEIGGFASMAARAAADSFKLRRPAEDFFDFDMVCTSF